MPGIYSIYLAPGEFTVQDYSCLKVKSLISPKSSVAKRFEELVRPHVRPLYRMAFKLTGSRHDAEDIVQDVLIKLYQKPQQLENIEDLRPWLLRVAYNQFVDFSRKQSRNPAGKRLSQDLTGDEDSLLPDPRSSPEQIAVTHQQSAEILAALDRLDPDQRALVVFHLMEGFTLEELTELFNTPLGTLKSRLHRIKATLKKLLLVEPLSPSERDISEGI